MSTYLEEAAAGIRKVQAASGIRASAVRDGDAAARREIRETRQRAAHAWLALAAIESGQARVTMAVPVADDPPGRAGQEGTA